jgi:hypothetical protein
MDDSQTTVNMMDKLSRRFDMNGVAAAIVEADELPIWSADCVVTSWSPSSMVTLRY